MAPEMFAHASHLTPKDSTSLDLPMLDMWALGLAFHGLLFSSLPWFQATAVSRLLIYIFLIDIGLVRGLICSTALNDCVSIFRAVKSIVHFAVKVLLHGRKRSLYLLMKF